MRTEDLPFKRYEGTADLGFGPRGGEYLEPMAEEGKAKSEGEANNGRRLRVVS